MTFRALGNSFIQGYTAGDRRFQNEMVVDDGYLMVANKETTDKAAPASDGDPAFFLPPVPTWASPTQTATAYSGLHILFNVFAVWDGIRVWLPEVSATIFHNVYVFDVTGLAPTDLANAILLDAVSLDAIVSTGWTDVNIPSRLIGPPKEIEIILETVKTSGPPTTWTHDWNFIGVSTGNPGATNLGENLTQTELQISDTDSGTTDQSTDLALVKVGDDIVVSESADLGRFNTYSVTSIADSGTHFTFGVLRVDNGNLVRSGRVVQVDATINAAQLAGPYVSLTDFWLADPAGLTVSGFATGDISSFTLDDNAYGCDIRLAELTSSPDWNIMALTGSGATGGGGATLSLSGTSSSATIAQVIDLIADATRAFGELFTNNGVAVMVNVTTPEKITSWISEGQSKNTTVDASNDQITLELAGRYRVTGSFTFTDGANETFQMQARVGGVAIDNLIAGAETSAGNETTASFSGFFLASIGDVLSVFVDATGADFVLKHGSFTVERVGS